MNYYPHILIDIARSFRKRQTAAEELLWKKLRAYQLHGLKFRLQHRIGRFIVDFYCAELRLVIEVEGGVHRMPEQRERDEVRFEELCAQGLNILRVKNEEVLNDIESVLGKISRFRNGLRPSPLSPLPKRERGT